MLGRPCQDGLPTGRLQLVLNSSRLAIESLVKLSLHLGPVVRKATSLIVDQRKFCGRVCCILVHKVIISSSRRQMDVRGFILSNLNSIGQPKCTLLNNTFNSNPVSLNHWPRVCDFQNFGFDAATAPRVALPWSPC